MKQNNKFLQAITSLFQDFLKDGTKALISFLFTNILNITGTSIILVALGILLSFLRWLEIPITIPVFLLLITVLVPVAAILGFQRLYKKRQSQRVIRVHSDGIEFVSRRQDNTILPVCPKCRSEMLEICNEEDNAARVIFGQQPRYIYVCKCGHQIVSSVSLSDLLTLIQKDAQSDKSIV
jgi:hypothetical protein